MLDEDRLERMIDELEKATGVNAAIPQVKWLFSPLGQTFVQINKQINKYNAHFFF
jgi:hypothetical protein